MNIILITALVAVLIATFIFSTFKLAQWVERVNHRLERLEEATSTRLPYHTIDGLEDLQAVLLDVKRYLNATQVRAEAASEIYSLLRNGDYDPDRPAGRRPQPEP